MSRLDSTQEDGVSQPAGTDSPPATALDVSDSQVKLLQARLRRERDLAKRILRKKRDLYKNSLVSLEERIRGLQVESASLQRQLSSIYGSLSWRLTSPIRWLDLKTRRRAKIRGELRQWLVRVSVALGLTKYSKTLATNAIAIGKSGFFDQDWYRRQYAAHPGSQGDPILHFLTVGFKSGCRPNPVFDREWYLKTNPDIAKEGMDPFLHYITYGAAEGRVPGPRFIPWKYLVANPDVLASGEDPCAHFVRTGRKEGRPLSPPNTLLNVEMERAEPDDGRVLDRCDVRAIAFYLPQFHAIPENNKWWGEGFTEWTNVRRGKPQFPGHYQPHIPLPEVGYYDLRNPEVLERQAAMARRFGIHGFCFYHYWFAGNRLLEMPVDRLLETARPDFPFCLCWANENWTRRWDGLDDEVLIAQVHTEENDERFIQEIIPALRDSRYIRIGERPLLIVYRPLLLPNPAKTFTHWRETCRREGVGEVFLAGVLGFTFTDPRKLGMDGAIEFPPNSCAIEPMLHAELNAPPEFTGSAYDYRQAYCNTVQKDKPEFTVFKGVIPSWDNTARRQNSGNVLVHNTPEVYESWLRNAASYARTNAAEGERLVFINAWNEWAEGCHLEPDEKFGFAWLNATRKALSKR